MRATRGGAGSFWTPLEHSRQQSSQRLRAALHVQLRSGRWSGRQDSAGGSGAAPEWRQRSSARPCCVHGGGRGARLPTRCRPAVFKPLAQELAANEEKIVKELIDCQGKPVSNFTFPPPHPCPFPYRAPYRSFAPRPSICAGGGFMPAQPGARRGHDAPRGPLTPPSFVRRSTSGGTSARTPPRWSPNNPPPFRSLPACSNDACPDRTNAGGSLSLSFCHILSLSYSLSFSLILSHSVSVIFSLILSHSLSFSFSLILILSHFLSHRHVPPRVPLPPQPARSGPRWRRRCAPRPPPY